MKIFTYLKAILSFLPFLDIYERKVQFYINSKGGIKSIIGGIFSVFLICVAFYSFLNNFQSWINGEQLRMISRYDSLSADEIAIKNLSLQFDLDHSNYNIFFTISSNIYSQVFFNENLQRYLDFSLIYFDIDSMYGRYIEWEYCSVQKMNEFLDLSDNSQKDEVYPKRICIKDGQDIKFEYTYDQNRERGLLNMTQFMFIIEKCFNSSANNFSCAPEEEIISVINTVHLSISLPRSYYDFNNVMNTRKRSFEKQNYYLDPNILQSYINEIMPIFLSTDHGLINTDYKLDSVDFNSETLSYQALSSEKNRQGYLFVYLIKPSLNRQFYYRKNENIFWLFSSLGGTINFFFVFGNIFIYFYNSLILKHRLIDISFSSDQSHKKETPTE